MTTIAANRHMLATDSQLTREDGPIASYKDKKLTRFSNGDVAGTMGRDSECIAFERWYENGCDPENDLELGEEQFAAIVLTSKGALFKYFHDLTPIPVYDEYIAIGDGDAVAYGAMDAGATPEEALEIACDRNIYTGRPVQVARI